MPADQRNTPINRALRTDIDTRPGWSFGVELSHPDLHSTIVGTVTIDYLQANLAAARKGPLPADVVAEARRRLAAAQL